MNIKQFIFNTFMVNCYLLENGTGEAILIDPACYEDKEKAELTGFVESNQLKVIRNINTHCHIDHILGNEFIDDTYGVRPEYHPDGKPFFVTAREIGLSFGYHLKRIPEPLGFLNDGDLIPFGDSTLKVLFTPGHAAGSICLYDEKNGIVFTGDVLFKDTIGRTDLPSGNFDQLMTSIRTKLFTLPDETVVLPGHGPHTTIGYEKMNNPFIR